MRPTSRTRPGSSPLALQRARAGYSVLEVLVVLAIMALAVALVMPRGALMIDRMTAHAVFFDFQRGVLDLRREAYAAQAPIVLYDTAEAAGRDPRGRVLPLRAQWTYRLAQPVRISEGGACRDGAVEILKAGRPIMRLAPDLGDCRFIRLE
jgi:prepilin-type N-terminal cleavage/methylation domain-containing protein